MDAPTTWISRNPQGEPKIISGTHSGSWPLVTPATSTSIAGVAMASTPGLLGLRGSVSKDAGRLAVDRIEETAGLDWLSTQILGAASHPY